MPLTGRRCSRPTRRAEARAYAPGAATRGGGAGGGGPPPRVPAEAPPVPVEPELELPPVPVAPPVVAVDPPCAPPPTEPPAATCCWTTCASCGVAVLAVQLPWPPFDSDRTSTETPQTLAATSIGTCAFTGMLARSIWSRTDRSFSTFCKLTL